MTSGYSGTPLWKKLGLKEGIRILLINEPNHYLSLIENWPKGITFSEGPEVQNDFIHFFATSKKELNENFPRLKLLLKPAGSFWVSWPKKTSKIDSEISENDVRETGLKNGLVDVKICAVDKDWAGLKFMFRKKDRK